MFGHPVYESFFIERPDVYSLPSSAQKYIWLEEIEFERRGRISRILYISLDSIRWNFRVSKYQLSVLFAFKTYSLTVMKYRAGAWHTSLVRPVIAYISFLIFFSLSLSLSLFSVPSTTLSPLYVVWRKLPRSNNDEKLVTDDSRIGGGTLDFCFTSYRFHAAFKYSISPLTLVTVLRRAEDSSRLHHARLNPRIAVPIWIVVFPL